MKFTPTEDRILVRPTYEETITPEGIHLPGKAREKPTRGVVVATGPGIRTPDGTRIPVGVQPGDTILFNALSYTEITLNDESLLVMREQEITGLLEDDDAVSAV